MSSAIAERIATAIANVRTVAGRIRSGVVATETDAEIRQRVEAFRRRIEESATYYSDRERTHRLKADGIHEEHWPHLEHPRSTPALELVQQFIAEVGPKSNLLVIPGLNGAGKSFAASWAVYMCGGLVVQAAELVSGSSFDASYWDMLEAQRVLAIDDLGTEARDVKGWFDSKWFALIDGRLGGGRKTLITTNLAAKAFMSRYAEGPNFRLKRRFDEFGKFRPVSQLPKAGGP